MLCRLLFALFLSLNALMATAQDLSEPKTYGALESWNYEISTQQLSLRGWSLGGRDGLHPPALMLTVGGQTYESTRLALNWATRSDIPSSHPATAGQAGVGFDWHVHLRSALPSGVHPVRVFAVFENGQRVTLKGAVTESTVVVVKKVERRHWRALALVVLSIVVVAYARRLGWISRDALNNSNA